MTFRHHFVCILSVACLVSAAVAVAQEKPQQQVSPDTAEADNPVTETVDSVIFDSAEGDFQIEFPGGCSQIRERIPDNEFAENTDGLLKMAIHAFCDRYGEKGEGCSVTAYVDEDLETGPPADPDFVMARIQNILKEYGVSVLNQKPYHAVLEDGPRVEGLDVLATDSVNRGQVWVRGLLVEGDVYILVAWRAEGQLAVDSEIVAFFDSFRAHSM